MRPVSETVLNIEPDALTQIVAIRDNEPGDAEFALFMEISGIKGADFAYELSFVPLDDAAEEDIVERHGELAVVLREGDRANLSGATLKIGAEGLAIDNPNSPSPLAGAAPAAGSLEGELADQVAQLLEQSINPGIAMHGGAARLVSVDDKNYVYVELTGGCQGCGLAAVTLKQGIERMIVETLPAVAGVIDVTDHSQGSDPYYQGSKK
jgi:Fe/S biogenesis protein NfuA